MTTKPKHSDRIEAAIKALADDPDIIALIDQTENGRSLSAGMTQYNYGAYMTHLHTLCPQPEENPAMFYVICKAFIRAGANENGIKAAAAILTGRDPMRAVTGI